MQALTPSQSSELFAASGANALASSGRGLPRVLMITQRTPFPPDKGDRIRSYHILKYLARRARVDLATLADEPVSRETESALRALASQLEVVPIAPRLRWVRAVASLVHGRSATEGLFASPELSRRLRQLTATTAYDLVLVVCSGMVQFLEGLPLGKARILVDLVDVDSEKWLDYAANSTGWRRLAYGLEGRRVRALEIALAGKCDQIAVVSNAEVECMLAFHATANVVAMANGVDFDFFHPNHASAVASDTCVFVGALDYKPNIDAVDWFCRAVWPSVRDASPTAKFTIVGRRPVKSVRQLAEIQGVDVVADVDDVRPWLWKNAVVVAPLRIARGVQNKILEALATGKPVIATPQAIEGLDATIGKHLVAACSPDEWATALINLMHNESDRRQLGASGRALICELRDWSQCLRHLDEILVLNHNAVKQSV